MRDCTPTREHARALSRDFALVPVYREILADMLTPVRAYSLLCPPGEPGFLLESVEGGERLARYSFIGVQARPLDLGAGNPLVALASVAGEQTAPVKGIPRFHGGAGGRFRDPTARGPPRPPAGESAGPPPPPKPLFPAPKPAAFYH